MATSSAIGSTDIAQRIRGARIKLKITDRQLAELSAIHITLIRRYERGQTRVGGKNAPKLAKALRLDVAELL